MWTVSSTGRSYVNGKALSKELRSLIIDKIISEEGNNLTGQFNSSYLANVWQQFCSTRTLSPKYNSTGRPSHLSYEDLCLIEALKCEKPTISYDEIWDTCTNLVIYRLVRFLQVRYPKQ